MGKKKTGLITDEVRELINEGCAGNCFYGLY